MKDAVAVLDPFVVVREGEDILRKQLLALSRDQLAGISKAYQLHVRVPRNPDVGELEESVDLMVRIVSRKARAA
jgi:hypothetical protein